MNHVAAGAFARPGQGEARPAQRQCCRKKI